VAYAYLIAFFGGLFGFGFLALLVFGGLFAAFAALGRHFTPRGGTWFGVTVFPWSLATGVAIVATATEYPPPLLWPVVFGAATAGACTLLGRGWAFVPVVAVAVIAIWVGLNAVWMDGLMVRAQALRDSTVRPYLTEVDGYYPWLEATRSDVGPEAYAAAYYRGEWAYETDMVPGFVISTERSSDGDPCETFLHAFEGQSGEEVIDCEREGERWTLTGPTIHQVAIEIDDLTIRSTAPLATPVDDLREAVEHARPMNDAEYRHLLLGPEYGCLPRYDCPSND